MTVAAFCSFTQSREKLTACPLLSWLVAYVPALKSQMLIRNVLSLFIIHSFIPLVNIANVDIPYANKYRGCNERNHPNSCPVMEFIVSWTGRLSKWTSRSKQKISSCGRGKEQTVQKEQDRETVFSKSLSKTPLRKRGHIDIRGDPGRCLVCAEN